MMESEGKVVVAIADVNKAYKEYRSLCQVYRYAPMCFKEFRRLLGPIARKVS